MRGKPRIYSSIPQAETNAANKTAADRSQRKQNRSEHE